ncbi:MAG: polysaccharide biosynthesis protein [Butyrivibrio sp.]|nr:polysaccharide biosynthesis protein [Butyrivibrio sp.]
MAETLNRKKNILVQGGILAIAGIISRIIGLLYTSPLTAIIGDEGNGYYSAAFYIYSIVLLISAYSIPSAMSKLLSQKLAIREYRNAQRIFRCALIYVFVIGGICSVAVFLGAGFLVHGASIPVLRVFAPAIFLFGPLGVLRGYFQAHRTMVPTSISQILEQFINALVSLSAAWFLVQTAQRAAVGESVRAMNGAIGSAIGTGSGVAVALLFMILVYRINRDEIKALSERDTHPVMADREIFRSIISVVTPFVLSTFIYNFSTTMNSTLFSRVLTGIRALPYSEVATRFGVFSRKAMVITNLPIAFANSAAVAIMPNISTVYAKNKIEDTAALIDKTNRIIMAIAIPSAVGLLALAQPIMMLLFPQKATLAEASMLLQILAVTVVFYSLSTVSNAMLQGVGRIVAPVRNAAAALIIQSVVLYLLLVYTDLGNISLAIATIVYSLMMCILNEVSLRHVIKVGQDYKRTVGMPLLSSLIMGAAAYGIYRLCAFLIGLVLDREYFVNLISVLIAVPIAMLVYGTILIRTGGVSREEIEGLPKGSSMVRLLERLHILRRKEENETPESEE